MNNNLKIGKHNVIFLTFDSCRYDVAKKANLPFLNKISPLRLAETVATYTLPSHISFFVGILPIIHSRRAGYLPGVDQIWRSINAKPRNKKTLFTFDGVTIMDWYKKNDYNVLGAGGVTFFKTQSGNILPSFFDNFVYFKKEIKSFNEKKFQREMSQFPLANLDKITSQFKDTKPFFLFVNCPETHIPYDCPNTIFTDEYIDAVFKMYSVDYMKKLPSTSKIKLKKEEVGILKEQQKKSLEWIDSRLELLISSLPKNGLPTLFLAMSDHGEEFGEGGRYGHAHNHKKVVDVPVWCGVIK